MAVAQLYYHIAPHNELSIVAKPLIRLLKSHNEVQAIVLSNIATISAERPVSGGGVRGWGWGVGVGSGGGGGWCVRPCSCVFCRACLSLT